MALLKILIYTSLLVFFFGFIEFGRKSGYNKMEEVLVFGAIGTGIWWILWFATGLAKWWTFKFFI